MLIQLHVITAENYYFVYYKKIAVLLTSHFTNFIFQCSHSVRFYIKKNNHIPN